MPPSNVMLRPKVVGSAEALTLSVSSAGPVVILYVNKSSGACHVLGIVTVSKAFAPSLVPVSSVKFVTSKKVKEWIGMLSLVPLMTLATLLLESVVEEMVKASWLPGVINAQV